MKTKYSAKDWQYLSAYIDGQLASPLKEKLEARLQVESALQEGLNSLNQTKMLLRQAKSLKTPRNFTITTAQAQALRPVRKYRFLPALSLSSALATIMMIFAILMELAVNPVALSKSTTNSNTGIIAMEAAPEANSMATSSALIEEPMIIEWGLPGQSGGGQLMSADGLGGGPSVKMGEVPPGMGGAEVIPNPSALLPQATPLPATLSMEDTQPVNPDAGPILGLRSAEDTQIYNQAVMDGLQQQAVERGMRERPLTPYLRWIQTGLAFIALITGGLALYFWRKAQH